MGKFSSLLTLLDFAGNLCINCDNPPELEYIILDAPNEKTPEILSRLDLPALVAVAPTIARDARSMARSLAASNPEASYQLASAAATIDALLPAATEKASLTKFQEAVHKGIQAKVNEGQGKQE